MVQVLEKWVSSSSERSVMDAMTVFLMNSTPDWMIGEQTFVESAYEWYDR
jgi:C4-dicarboxylate-specific signal transduction histidine kinase